MASLKSLERCTIWRQAWWISSPDDLQILAKRADQRRAQQKAPDEAGA
jgi:hypothetical protein